MSKIRRFSLIAFFLIFTGTGLLFSADNRFALVIGNGHYKDSGISVLTNPVNDATDVAAALKGLGYNVILKTDTGLRDMMDAVQDFSFNLRRSPENEGLFWFAGHGLSVRGIHYMLPVDVDPVNDNIIARGSYSVDDLMEEIGNARNRTNLVVIDACRNTLLPGGSRSVGSRGLAVLAADDYRVAGNKIVYSTMAGRTAADGLPGSRNSPFAQAFIQNIGKPESFDDVFLDIANETMRLTRGEQQPYSMGSFAVKSYTINTLPPVAQAAPGSQAAPVQQPAAPLPSPESPRAEPRPPAAPKAPRAPTDFSLDGKKVFSIGAAPTINFQFMSPGAGLNITFYEQYGNYRETFFLPNSFFFSANYFRHKGGNFSGSDSFGWYVEGNDPMNAVIMDLGALWKIRLEESQRLIARLGFSFALHIVNLKQDFHYTHTSTSVEDDYIKSNTRVNPGINLHTGLDFRFTKLVSLGLGFSLGGDFGDRGSFYEVRVYDGGNSFDIGHELIYRDMGDGYRKLPISMIGALYLSFWVPR